MSYITYEVSVYNDGSQRWYRYGKLHREDGPAVIRADGSQKWYRNGEMHREDGPAGIYPNGARSWYKDGKFHREDGPAIISTNGDQSWYINGEKLTEQEFLEKTQPAKELTVAEIEKLLGHRIKVVKG